MEGCEEAVWEGNGAIFEYFELFTIGSLSQHLLVKLLNGSILQTLQNVDPSLGVDQLEAGDIVERFAVLVLFGEKVCGDFSFIF